MSEVQGKIYRIGNTETFGANGFTKRELIVEVPGQYPQFIALELHKDKCSLVDGRKVGDQVHAYYNLNGRLWTSPKGEERCFNSLLIWKLTALGQAEPASYPPTPNAVSTPVGQIPDSDEMPF